MATSATPPTAPPAMAATGTGSGEEAGIEVGRDVDDPEELVAEGNIGVCAKRGGQSGSILKSPPSVKRRSTTRGADGRL
jgi:hypothetical protein